MATAILAMLPQPSSCWRCSDGSQGLVDTEK